MRNFTSSNSGAKAKLEPELNPEPKPDLEAKPGPELQSELEPESEPQLLLIINTAAHWSVSRLGLTIIIKNI